MSYTLNMFGKVLPALDRKDYSLYDKLSEQERKNFAAVVIMRWEVNIIDRDPDIQHYYVGSVNEYANTHLYTLYKHPKLQWLIMVASSPGIGTKKRKWVGKKKKANTARDKRKKQLKGIYPTYKNEDIELLADIVTSRELTQYAKDCGKK
jgi:hypothetical protein